MRPREAAAWIARAAPWKLVAGQALLLILAYLLLVAFLPLVTFTFIDVAHQQVGEDAFQTWVLTSSWKWWAPALIAAAATAAVVAARQQWDVAYFLTVEFLVLLIVAASMYFRATLGSALPTGWQLFQW